MWFCLNLKTPSKQTVLQKNFGTLKHYILNIKCQSERHIWAQKSHFGLPEFSHVPWVNTKHDKGARLTMTPTNKNNNTTTTIDIPQQNAYDPNTCNNNRGVFSIILVWFVFERGSLHHYSIFSLLFSQRSLIYCSLVRFILIIVSESFIFFPNLFINLYLSLSLSRVCSISYPLSVSFFASNREDQTIRQTDIQKHGQRDGLTDGRMDRHTGKQTNRFINKQ